MARATSSVVQQKKMPFSEYKSFTVATYVPAFVSTMKIV
jgi:hypothetical protein